MYPFVVADPKQTTLWPEGLTVETPRPVRLTSNAVNGRIFLILLTAGFAILMPWLGQRDVSQLRDLRRSGVVANCPIYDKTETHGKSSSWTLRFTLAVPGYTEDMSESVDSDTYESLRIGDTTPVTYLPDEPRVNRYGLVDAGRVESATGGWIMGTIALLAVSGLSLLILGAVIRGQQRLLTYGDRTEAEILENVPPQKGSKQTLHTVTFRLAQPYEAKPRQAMLAPPIATAMPVGSRVPAVVDHEDPSNVRLLATFNCVRL